MSNRDIFSKHLPNVKLATRYDAEGREVQVERREDADAVAREQDTFDILVAAGYYRARIKGLSAFDKVVGGMTWCIECCDYDVDVDLLFHENLTIGQKIVLVEKIVAVLPQMKCPYSIEPHQIQGLEFLSIHPVIQWLVKTSVENRTERGQRLKKFAIGQFHNYYQYQTDRDQLIKIRNASTHIKNIQQKYSACRQYQRNETTIKDEILRVRSTLLEYGYKGGITKPEDCDNTSGTSTETTFEEENSIEKLLKNMSLLSEVVSSNTQRLLENGKRQALQQHYQEIKQEMETDAKHLSEQNQLKRYEAAKVAFTSKLEKNKNLIDVLKKDVINEEENVAGVVQVLKQLNSDIKGYKKLEFDAEASILGKIQQLLKQHDELKKQEVDFKEYCRTDLTQLQKEIDDLVAFNSQNPVEQEAAASKERARIQELRLQLAKRNRGIVAIERKLDAIPDRTELAQYQRRFHELYNQMSAKHLETKQYYTLFNTLNDKKRYMEKELSLLNSICEAYNTGMLSQHGREDFIKQFETIVTGVKQTEDKIRHKYNDERLKRDNLNEELLSLMELQRQYAAAVKHLTKECQNCEQLQKHLKSFRKK